MSGLVKYLLPILSSGAIRDFERAASDPHTYQADLLDRLLKRNQETAFGKDHGFSGIHHSADYRKRVPIRDFEGFRPYVDRLIAGERNILTEEHPFVYATTSGTTGKPKLIPVTSHFRDALKSTSRVWLRRALQDYSRLLDHTVLSAVSPAIEGHTDNGQPIGSMSGITYKNMPMLLRKQYTLPYTVMELKDYDLRYVIMMRIALEAQVSLAGAPNPSTWLRLATTGETYAEQYIRAIRDGTLGYRDIKDLKTPNASDQEKLDELSEGLRPNKRRAKELEYIVNNTGHLRPKDAWPHLALVGCWLGGSAGIQAKLLREYYGDAPMRDVGFRASEAAVTVPITDNTAAGVLACDINYYEFVPESEIESSDPIVLEAHELEVGKSYYLLLTTASGLYRYDINDVIRVESFYRRAPIIAFVRKGRDMVNLTGEKLHVNQVIEALNIAEAKGPVNTAQFRIIPDLDNMRYDLLVELVKGRNHDDELETFLTRFDFSLADLNDEYYQKRVSRRLQAPRLVVMKPGWGEREKRRAVDSGKRETQFKWAVIQLEWNEVNQSEIHHCVEARRTNIERDHSSPS